MITANLIEPSTIRLNQRISSQLSLNFDKNSNVRELVKYWSNWKTKHTSQLGRVHYVIWDGLHDHIGTTSEIWYFDGGAFAGTQVCHVPLFFGHENMFYTIRILAEFDGAIGFPNLLPQNWFKKVLKFQNFVKLFWLGEFKIWKCQSLSHGLLRICPYTFNTIPPFYIPCI